MSRQSGTIIPWRPSHRAHTSLRPVNLIAQTRRGLSERGVLVSLRAPGAVFVDIVRSWRAVVIEIRKTIQVRDVTMPVVEQS